MASEFSVTRAGASGSPPRGKRSLVGPNAFREAGRHPPAGSGAIVVHHLHGVPGHQQLSLPRSYFVFHDEMLLAEDGYPDAHGEAVRIQNSRVIPDARFGEDVVHLVRCPASRNLPPVGRTRLFEVGERPGVMGVAAHVDVLKPDLDRVLEAEHRRSAAPGVPGRGHPRPDDLPPPGSHRRCQRPRTRMDPNPCRPGCCPGRRRWCRARRSAAACFHRSEPPRRSCHCPCPPRSARPGRRGRAGSRRPTRCPLPGGRRRRRDPVPPGRCRCPP